MHIVFLTIALILGSFQATHGTVDDEDIGLVDHVFAGVGSAWEGITNLVSAGSKKLLGRSRHESFVDYVAYLGQQAKAAGTSMGEFVHENWNEIEKELSPDEEEQLKSYEGHDEL